MSNLISNAIKYTAKGKVKIQADFIEVAGRHKLIVHVEDTGIGITQDQKDQVFRKYYVANSKNRSGGFGLGLYISKILSEQLGGDISFSSKFEKGSIFTFELPMEKKHIQTTKRQTYTVADIPDDLHILIVDDSRISLFFAQQLFQTKRNIRLFHNAKQAWAHMQANKVDIVITDLIMPEMDGWQLLHHIKSEPAQSDIRVLVSTAEPMLLEEKSEHQHKFDGVIGKPIQEHDIVRAILNA